jgi:hypothetical protein
MNEKGYSLIESSLCLALFLFILIAVFESFGITRSLFFKLKRAEEDNQSALAALDKMRIDLIRAGSGLAPQIRMGLVEGVAIINSELVISRREKECFLLADISPGENRMVLETAAGLSPGREVCVFNDEECEIRTISSILGKTVLVDAPFKAYYSMGESQVAPLDKTFLFFDQKSGSIRRKVNTSSPQPLLDDILFFDFFYHKDVNLAGLNFALINNKEKKYEVYIYPKNVALGLPRP